MTTSATAEYKASHLDRAYVDWASIVAGALVAIAIFTTLMVFGSAIGLSLTSSDPAQGISAQIAAIAIGIWAAWVAAMSFAAGGYIAGRLRHRIPEATADEVKMRDGTHGLVTWAIATIVSGILLATWIGAPASSAIKDAAATGLNAEVAQLFQGEKAGTASALVHNDAASILKTVTGRRNPSEAQHNLLTQLVVAQTGVAAGEATTRVNAAVSTIHASADTARRGSVLAAFLTAAALAIGAAAAFGAAIAGGRNRDDGNAFSPLTRWH